MSSNLLDAFVGLHARSLTRSDCKPRFVYRTVSGKWWSLILSTGKWPLNFYSSRANSSRKFEHVSDVSSQEYFFQLLSSWGQEWLRLPLLQGLATSAVAGAEGLVRASRAALIQFLNSHNPHSDPNILIEVLQVLSTALNDNLPDDRYAIPLIELISFLLDSYHGYTVAGPNGSNPVFRKLFLLVQKAHFRSANIARMEGAVKVYAALSGIGNLRGDVLKKLTAMLLHPFPRVWLPFNIFPQFHGTNPLFETGSFKRSRISLHND